MKFAVGNIVRPSDKFGWEKTRDQGYSPRIPWSGKIIQVRKDTSLPYEVRWRNGVKNAYRESDLELFSFSEYYEKIRD